MLTQVIDMYVFPICRYEILMRGNLTWPLSVDDAVYRFVPGASHSLFFSWSLTLSAYSGAEVSTTAPNQHALLDARAGVLG